MSIWLIFFKVSLLYRIQLEVIYSIAQICELGLVMKTLSKLLKDKSKRIDRLLRTQTLNKEPKEI